MPWDSGAHRGKGCSAGRRGRGFFSPAGGRKGSVEERVSRIRVRSWKVLLAVERFIAYPPCRFSPFYHPGDRDARDIWG